MKMRRPVIMLMAILLAMSPLSARSAAKPQPDKAAVATGAVRYAGEDSAGWWNALWKDAHLTVDLFAKSTLLRGENVPGGGLSIGVETEDFRFAGYGQMDYFMRPFAGDGIATMEAAGEIGANLGWKFLDFWAFNVWATCDIGYFTQLVMGLPYAQDQLVMGYSGLMIRPKLLTELNIAKYYDITAGVYYQLPVYPAYDDYTGLGIMLSIM